MRHLTQVHPSGHVASETMAAQTKKKTLDVNKENFQHIIHEA